MPWAPSTRRIPKLVEVLHGITALACLCCRRIVSSSLPLLSCFSWLDPVHHSAAPARPSCTPLTKSHHPLLTVVPSGCFSPGFVPFTQLSIPPGPVSGC